jgi:hypothetical protein
VGIGPIPDAIDGDRGAACGLRSRCRNAPGL